MCTQYPFMLYAVLPLLCTQRWLLTYSKTYQVRFNNGLILSPCRRTLLITSILGASFSIPLPYFSSLCPSFFFAHEEFYNTATSLEKYFSYIIPFSFSIHLLFIPNCSYHANHFLTLILLVVHLSIVWSFTAPSLTLLVFSATYVIIYYCTIILPIFFFISFSQLTPSSFCARYHFCCLIISILNFPYRKTS